MLISITERLKALCFFMRLLTLILTGIIIYSKTNNITLNPAFSSNFGNSQQALIVITVKEDELLY